MITKEIEDLRHFENAFRYYCREAGFDPGNIQCQNNYDALARPFLGVKALIGEDLNALLGLGPTWSTWGSGGLLLGTSSSMVLTDARITATNGITWTWTG